MNILGKILSYNLENLFVYFALFFGLLIVFINPPFMSPDEPNHFFRAYAIASGDILPLKINNNSGSDLPNAVIKFHEKYNLRSISSNKLVSLGNASDLLAETKFLDNSGEVPIIYNNTAVYAPTNYLPQSLSIFIFKNLVPSPVYLFYLARIFSLIFYIICGYVAIKSLPILKLPTFFILLLPMSLFLASNISSDTVFIAVSVLLISKILQYRFTDKTLDLKQILFLIVCLSFVCLAKNNFIFTLLLFLLPKNKFNNNYIFKLILIVVLSILPMLIWSKLASPYFVPLKPNVNIYNQIDFILHNPIDYSLIMLHTFYGIKNFYVSAIGVLGWLDVFLPKIFYPMSTIIFFVISAISDMYSKKLRLSSFAVLCLWGFCIIYFIYNSTLIYLTWADYGTKNIAPFLQGRYFIPVLLPLALTVNSTFLLTTKKVSERLFSSLSALVILFVPLILCFAVSKIIRVYY